MNITEIIKPIRLLSGSHADTGATGQGCIMNVIAYLNGESQITDQSECVCPSIRPIAIRLNDMATDAQRGELLSFIERAMGSVTTDREVMMTRLNHVVVFANKQAKHAAEYAESAKSAEDAAKSAEYAEYAAEYAKYAAKSAKYAAKYAKDAAKDAAKSAKYAAKDAAEFQKQQFADGLALMDAICPPAEAPSAVVVDRARELVRIGAEA